MPTVSKLFSLTLVCMSQVLMLLEGTENLSALKMNYYYYILVKTFKIKVIDVNLNISFQMTASVFIMQNKTPLNVNKQLEQVFNGNGTICMCCTLSFFFFLFPLFLSHPYNLVFSVTVCM